MRTQPREIAALMVLVLTVISVWLPNAHATRIPKKDLRQLAGESAVIVIGTVVGASYERDPKEGVIKIYESPGEKLTTCSNFQKVEGKYPLGVK